MKIFPTFVAALWLFAVSAQGLSHLVKYGLVPALPEWIGRALDLTPQYTLLMGLVVVTAVAVRIKPHS